MKKLSLLCLTLLTALSLSACGSQSHHSKSASTHSSKTVKKHHNKTNKKKTDDKRSSSSPSQPTQNQQQQMFSNLSRRVKSTVNVAMILMAIVYCLGKTTLLGLTPTGLLIPGYSGK